MPLLAQTSHRRNHGKLFCWQAHMLACFCLIALTAITAAQVPPSDRERAAYEGLHKAALEGDVEAIGQAIAQGADLNPIDGHGRTPLMVATFANQQAAVARLMEAGANSDQLEYDRYDALTIAAVDGNAEMVRLLISKGAKTGLITSIYDGTALIAAAHLGHHDVVKALIDGGAPLDHVNNLKWTALIESIVLGDGGTNHVETLRALVQAGADVNLADGAGQTPLQLARSRGYDEMVEILINAGAK